MEQGTTPSLSLRLQSIAIQVPSGVIVADIGTDHAQLPIYLVSSGTCQRVIAGEYHQGPFLSACRNVEASGLQDKIKVRQGDGLDVVQPSEADVIIISGMGGALISSILERGKSVTQSVQRLILQPNVGEDAVRRWFLDNKWRIKNETIIQEDHKIYEVLTAERGESHDLYEHPFVSKEWLLQLGPLLVRQQDPLLLQKWTSEYEKRKKMVRQMERSHSEEALRRKRMMTKQLEQLGGILEWLRTEIQSSKP